MVDFFVGGHFFLGFSSIYIQFKEFHFSNNKIKYLTLWVFFLICGEKSREIISLVIDCDYIKKIQYFLCQNKAMVSGLNVMASAWRFQVLILNNIQWPQYYLKKVYKINKMVSPTEIQFFSIC